MLAFSMFMAWMLASSRRRGAARSGVDGGLGSVAGDAEVGGLDVNGDDLAGVGGSDTEPLAGDHDDAVLRDLALGAGRGPLAF
jgi:hypothetical protein